MGSKVESKEGSYKHLIEKISETSGYHIYEVKDILNHLVGNMQILLGRGIDVKLSGIGTIRCKKMFVKNTVNGKKLEYTTHRLSIVTDTPMKRYIKDNHASQTREGGET